MEAESALIRADGAAHLNAESAIHLDVALIVDPGDAKHDYAFRLDHALKDARFLVFRVFREGGT